MKCLCYEDGMIKIEHKSEEGFMSIEFGKVMINLTLGEVENLIESLTNEIYKDGEY